MVNFFEHQQQARRNTWLLVGLFIVAFTLIIIFVTAVVAIAFGVVDSTQQGDFTAEPSMLSWTAFFVGIGILLVMGVKWLQLRPGGHVVAESLGGVRLSPDTQDPVERRVQNVVEEMAIAANMPVPDVYILPNESAINAFAAGYQTRDAVIGLTKGSIETFSREELQAVVAHEFSHILNGDMRLNIRLISALAGILVVAHLGRMLLYSAHFSRGSRNRNNALPLLGIALIVIGSIGILFGNLIKSAVSRQREYLADAAAVQFTRHPDSLAGALKQIGARNNDDNSGSKVAHKNADQTAHLFFGEALSHWFGMMATHPPLEKRIKRIQPGWNGKFPEPRQAFSKTEEEQVASKPEPNALSRLAALALPALLLEQAHSPKQAPSLIQDLLFSHMEEGADTTEQGAGTKLSAAQILALVEIAVPALRQASDSERTQLFRELDSMGAQHRLFPWCLYQLLARQLLPRNHFSNKLGDKEAAETTITALEQAENGETPDLAKLSRALTTCRNWSPKAKARLVSQWLKTVQQDEIISETEQKLVATLCACIEVPLPDEMLT
ncbi:M48 family metallopeptidase [Pseudidiomarina sp.]|uniref:M48 family metallopeptidase n=1 Tax=Pseudidiomarina sp. TaxID=2081707 RepID=UPI00299D8489|nr:M48 family metallopeptidase [Pseudidiomarina sp.]MDX1705418.1 M48 family metallopeptidase [Pseudidiomarina sp.]